MSVCVGDGSGVYTYVHNSEDHFVKLFSPYTDTWVLGSNSAYQIFMASAFTFWAILLALPECILILHPPPPLGTCSF